MRKATRFAALLLSMSLALTAAGCAETASSEESAAAASEVTTEAAATEEAASTDDAASEADSTDPFDLRDLFLSGPADESEDADVAVEGTEADETDAAAADESITSAPAVTDVMDSSDFVVLAEVCPDIIQEIRYYSTYNFVGDRIAGYEEPVALMTREAAEALADASDLLMEQGYRLKIYDAYRPQKAVDNFVAWAEDLDDIRMKDYFYPEVDKENLFSDGYIDAKSGHSRGSTVDLTIVDMATGKEVDMGGTFDHFGIESHPDYTGSLTEEQLANRLILRDAMIVSGFKPLSTEWWHFTLRNEPYPDTYFDFNVNAHLE